ncbi:hypothetical protein [Saccharopolyspora spinosa]|uniref:Uncharacterized protein n=1 Tax=Saccharopolyspora spinosa TaxID=60894 RepID=A0A2N3Y6Q5_SACSN|nr:hypothetical protein [Saccharopolyspora spinosa]PKW18616.1 hypothetical protein A8926_6719 [Saccharopolyspora spinosa]
MFLRELYESVRQRLEDVLRVVSAGDDRAVTAVARSEVPHLIDAVRTLMAGHEPNEIGECPACSRTLWRWKKPWRRPTSPCTVYLAARRALFDETDEPRHALH